MHRLRTVSALIFLLVAGHSQAETEREACEVLGASIGSSAISMRNLLNTIKKSGTIVAATKVSGESRQALEELNARRLALLPSLQEYVNQLEDASYLLVKCAR